MNTPKPGELVKLTKPLHLNNPNPLVVPTHLTPADTFVFMGAEEGKWRVMTPGILVPAIGVTAFRNAQFLIPIEYFEESK